MPTEVPASYGATSIAKFTPHIKDERCTYEVLGVNVDVVQIQDAIARIEQWIADYTCRSWTAPPSAKIVTLTNVHAVMQARRDPAFRTVLNEADMVCPDGMPLAWVGRLRGRPVHKNVPGPDLMFEFCRRTHQRGYSHYFCGGAEGVAEKLAERLSGQFSGMRIAGVYSPPFRPLAPPEDRKVVERINDSGADVLWVGLGCPKQETWMHQHRGMLRVPVMLGVGQAFDIHAGTLKRAPKWMIENGLEWLFRLCSEPRRLWKRYFVTNTSFLALLARDAILGRPGMR